MSKKQESYKRYGKPSSPLLNLKISFFEENDIHLKDQIRIASVFINQPKRTRCKNCNNEIKTTHDFIKGSVEYILCGNCTHLNGAYEDTFEFSDAVYTEDQGDAFAKFYTESNLDDYNYRTTSIYTPKAVFWWAYAFIHRGISITSLS